VVGSCIEVTAKKRILGSLARNESVQIPWTLHALLFYGQNFNNIASITSFSIAQCIILKLPVEAEFQTRYEATLR
jgi:hypothetical protein